MTATATPAMVPGAGWLACEAAPPAAKVVLEVLEVDGLLGVGEEVSESGEEGVREGWDGAREECGVAVLVVIPGDAEEAPEEEEEAGRLGLVVGVEIEVGDPPVVLSVGAPVVLGTDEDDPGRNVFVLC
jgi:hypothetical protein